MATGNNLTEEQRAEFIDLASQFQGLFTEAPGTTSLAQHHIKLTSDQPARSRPYPVPYSLRESLKKDITDIMKMGVIRESSSPYASPVVVVKKKDNTNRICVDYRKSNKLTVFDPEPMPTAEHLFQKLNGDKYFTRIDLSKGYWQISIPEEDIPKTAFVTPDGSYEFLQMPFGMINFAALAAPLSDLTRKGQPNKVEWGEAQEKAYQSIKTLLTKNQSCGCQIQGKPTFCGLTLPTVVLVLY